MSEQDTPTPLLEIDADGHCEPTFKLPDRAEPKEVHPEIVTLPDTCRNELRPHAEKIKKHLYNHNEDTLAIGDELLIVKAKLKGYPKGAFGEWLKENFGWMPRTAQRFMKAARFCQDHPKAKDLPPSAICLLAASTMPEEALAAVLCQVENGERPKLADIQAHIPTSPRRRTSASAKGAARNAAKLMLDRLAEVSEELRDLIAEADAQEMLRCLRTGLDLTGEEHSSGDEPELGDNAGSTA